MKFVSLATDVYVWPDPACNVYILRDRDRAVLIDLGSGSVLSALSQLGVKQVEWVLFTHHHREQCQGAGLLDRSRTQCAAPEAEASLFQAPHAFRKMNVSLGDAFTVHGASYVRPPLAPVAIDRTFKTMDAFEWRGRELWCVATPGNSPGGMSYILNTDDGRIAFSGDVMLDGARWHNWFDVEWDYGMGKGLYALYNSASLLKQYDARWLAPSHGPTIEDPSPQLQAFMQKLRTLVPLFLRGYDLQTFAGGDQDNVSTPTDVPHVWHISPHLYKFKGPDFWPNFTLILSDSGRGLIVDCGLFNREFLDRSIRLMHERLGLKQIDALLVTHFHGDHMLDAQYLRETWGAQVWTLDLVAEKCERPEDFELSAPIQSYKNGLTRVQFDRIFAEGDTFDWEDYRFTIDWMPGQTKFHACIHGRVDERLVAFTGDNIFGSPTNPTNNGHECVMARNGGILEEGYIYAARYLKRLQPDLLIGGHSWVMDRPAALIDRYLATAEKLRDALQALSGDDDYRRLFDPYWVRAHPYRQRAQPGDELETQVHVRNFKSVPQQHRIVVQTPPGVTASPAVLEGAVGPEETKSYPVRFKLAVDAPQQMLVAAFDATLDGRHYGPWFDCLFDLSGEAAPAESSPPKKKDASGSY